MSGTSTIVVGVDGSPGSRAALEHGLEDAARRAARLRVIAAVRLPDYWAAGYGLAIPPLPTGLVEEARQAVQAVVDDVVAEHPDLVARIPEPIVVEARAGAPGEVLIEASQGADLLVIGHRGRGGFASAVLGSVGLQCVLHAPCPVTVVRPVADPPDADTVTSGAITAPAPA